MKLVSGTIYKCIPFLSSPTKPTLYISGAVTLYVSLSQKQPASLAEMTDATAQVKVGFNILSGQIRYIAAEFDADVDVLECGIVTSQEQLNNR